VTKTCGSCGSLGADGYCCTMRGTYKRSKRDQACDVWCEKELSKTSLTQRLIAHNRQVIADTKADIASGYDGTNNDDEGQEMTDYIPREWQLGEVCQHGSLGRQCEACQAQHERDWALEVIERLRAEVDKARQSVVSELDLEADELFKNACGLLRYEVDEARAREMAALVLRELVFSLRLKDRLAELDRAALEVMP